MATRSTERGLPEPPSLIERLEAAGWPTWELLALVAVTLLAFALRFHELTAAPLIGDNQDDLQFTWLGLNLIEHGDALTWSYFPGYASYNVLHAFGSTFPLVHDWMDHPPLFGYVMGGWVWLLGARSMLDVTPAQVHSLPAIFSTATVPLVYLLGRPMLGRVPSLIGAALLATAPAAVLMGREAEPESLQAILLLAALLATRRIVDRGPGRWSLGVVLVCGLAAPFMKVSGIAIAGICLVILFVEGRWRLALATGLAGAGGLLLYVLYGWIVNWQLFLHIFGLQNGNRLGILTAIDFITAPTGINRSLHDGWWILGWIGLGLLLALRNRRRELFLVWPAVAYAAVMMVMAGTKQTEQYGWYKVIIYPEVYLAAGFLAWTVVSRASISGITMLLILGGATATNWWLGGIGRGWAPNPVLLVVLVLAILVPAAWSAWRQADEQVRRVAVAVAQAALVVLLLGNTIESVFLAQILGVM
jgi:MYXO-CTERM domain-containing protein